MSVAENENQLLGTIQDLQPTNPVSVSVFYSPFLHKTVTFAITFIFLYMANLIVMDNFEHKLPIESYFYFGLGLYIFSVMSMFVVYLKRFWASYLASIRHLALIGFLSTLIILIDGITFSLSSPYFSFLPAFAMLVRIFTNFQISLVLTILIALSNYLLNNTDPTILTVNLFAGIISVFSLTKIQQRKDLAKAGLLVSGVSVWMIVTLNMLRVSMDFDKLLIDLCWGGASGISSAIIAIGSLAYLETLFGLVTSFKLFELANPNQPLLRQLMIKAPGTYQHSLIVGNLAEAAAESINADPLLTRVGALYHDIGKMVRPYFFIENQLGIENQHSKISPRLSALVITAHVKEGLELAKEYKLPSIISDFIPMHHGTSLVSYFYHQARQTENPVDVIEAHFRYPGPKPRTKETAILMLADAAEAAVRSIAKPTVEQIQKTINKIIKARIDDGQLAEAPLTLVDFERISTEFLRIFQSLYHSRIEYPSEEKILKELGKKVQK